MRNILILFNLIIFLLSDCVRTFIDEYAFAVKDVGAPVPGVKVHGGVGFCFVFEEDVVAIVFFFVDVAAIVIVEADPLLDGCDGFILAGEAGLIVDIASAHVEAFDCEVAMLDCVYFRRDIFFHFIRIKDKLILAWLRVIVI